MEEQMVDFRLKNIENILNEMKTLLVSVPILTDTVNKMDGRLLKTEKDLNALFNKVRELELAPTKLQANRFMYIIDYVYKSIVGLAVTAVTIYIFKHQGG